MAAPVNLAEAGDSADLQALFDSIATAPVQASAVAEPNPSGDSDELQALFDTVVSHVSAPIEDALKTMAAPPRQCLPQKTMKPFLTAWVK